MTAAATVAADARAGSIFQRVLVGVDGSPESREAARQAARLTASDGWLTLLAAYEDPAALVSAPGVVLAAAVDRDRQRERAEAAVYGVRNELTAGRAPVAKVARGRASAELIREAEREDDRLIAVGSHGVGRALGILVGSTVTELVHRAPCSVLVARTAGTSFPRRIVVGVDGSPQSLLAARVAGELVERLGASMRAIAATGGKPVDVDGLVKVGALEATALAAFREAGHPAPIRIPLLEWSAEKPVDALVAASADADLVIVGTRGLHGFSALGSVAERVAHRAAASVLIVRQPDGDGRG